MDFQFSQHWDQVVAKCSMEHIALANWFNTEVKLNSQLISTALCAVEQAKSFKPDQEEVLIGKEYSLFINHEEVMVRANNLDILHNNDTELEPDFHYYDEESLAFLGLEDFEQFLRAAEEFSQ